MTDAKREALVLALQYHNSSFGAALIVDKKPARPTAEQIVTTARKFEAFLDQHSKKR